MYSNACVKITEYRTRSAIYHLYQTWAIIRCQVSDYSKLHSDKREHNTTLKPNPFSVRVHYSSLISKSI